MSKKLLIKIIVALVIISIICFKITNVSAVALNSIPEAPSSLSKYGLGMMGGLICYAIAMIISIVFGIIYFTSKKEKKEKIRKSVMPYLIAAVIVFAFVGYLVRNIILRVPVQ